MPRLIVVRLFGAVLASVFAAGCGGGGGGASSQVITTPMISTAQPPSGMTGVASAFTFVVTSGGLAPFTWTETGALPSGLSLSSTGMLSGTPATAGTFPITVTVTDSSTPPLTDSMPFSVKIADSPIIVSTAPPPPAGTLTYPYAGYSFTVASGGSPLFTWAVTKGSPPPGIAVGSDGSLSGTPTAAGSFAFTVTATDSAQTPESGSQLFTVDVKTPGPPVITLTPTPPAGVADSSYPGFNFTATGGYLPLSWAVTMGTLPPGLTLASSGALTGTPTTIGTFPFTVTVTDSAPTPKKNSVPFSITINAPPPPTINATALPTGTVGVAYPTVQFTASNGYLPLVWSETGALPTALSLSAGGLLSGTPSEDGQFPIKLYVKDSLNRTSPAAPFTVRVSLARAAAGFTQTKGMMNSARFGHTATLLPNGQVLIAGGTGDSAQLASAELYDPTSQLFTATGSMTMARSGHTATLLADKALPNYGNVLVAAGGSQTAELYDPTSGMFTATGSMAVTHDEPTATLLKNGQVLIAGGGTASAELYNPGTGIFTTTGNMTIARSEHSATLLPNGQVLIAGGYGPMAATSTAELYDPASGTFTATGSMSAPRAGHTATLLANGPALTNGSVVIAGPDLTAEVFDPATGTFSLVGDLLTATGGATANLRNDGTVLVAGGYFLESLYRYGGGYNRGFGCYVFGHASVSLRAAELFAPESEGFTATGSLNTARYGHTATVLADGTVFITGGVMSTVLSERCGGLIFYRPFRSISTVLSTAELFK